MAKPHVWMIGNAHIDPVWLWQWQDGYQEIRATFRSALDRMNEDEDFVFTCACAEYYRYVEENLPEMFEEIRTRVAEGRWVLAGGMWIQPDMNAPDGESFARQLLYSQRYFMEKFGKTARFGYNVDSFGHHAMAPQLFVRAGIHDYVWMRPQLRENAQIPEGSMWWESPDGSRVLASRIEAEYTRPTNVAEKIDHMLAFSDRLDQPVLCFYGVGNHGGGPTVANIREIQDYRATAERGDEARFGAPSDLFRQLREEGTPLPVWRGELQHHASGCYSTHSKSKRKHRMAENALTRMEKLGMLSRALTGHELRPAFTARGWQNLMFNEFHDLMGGCSLKDSLEDCVVQLDEAISIASREENAALQRLSWQIDTTKGEKNVSCSKDADWFLWGNAELGTPVVVFNPHEFDAECTVRMLRPIRSVENSEGTPVAVQRVRAARTNGKDHWDSVFRARVPALGYALYWAHVGEPGEQSVGAIHADDHTLDNGIIRAEFDAETGELKWLGRSGGKNTLSGTAEARLVDIEHCDTWAHMVFRFDKPAGGYTLKDIELIENGPVSAAIRVRTERNGSMLTRVYRLYVGDDRLNVEVRLNMTESHRMLKLCLPTVWKDGHDVSEIPYGVLERTACGNEEHCQRWIAMQGEDGGLMVINDGKYSYSAENGELCLTVANTSLYADHYGQDYRDNSCIAMDTDAQEFKLQLLPYEGGWQAANPHRAAALLNQPMPYTAETYHKGKLPAETRGIRIDRENVRLGAFKRAEDGHGSIVRIAEATGSACKVHVELYLLGRAFDAELGAWEIRTVYIPDDPDMPVRDVLITEE